MLKLAHHSIFEKTIKGLEDEFASNVAPHNKHLNSKS